jgi:hypothetical protein
MMTSYPLTPNCWIRLLHFLDLETWWQRLLELFCLLLVEHNEGVEISGAADLELGVVLVLLYLDGAGILTAGLDEKVFDFFDFFWHFRLKGEEKAGIPD